MLESAVIMSWILHSPVFEHGHTIPVRHTADGADISPPLEWTDPPRNTRQMALVVEDPDAPSLAPWTHWLVYRIAARCRQLPEDLAPVRNPPNLSGALQGRNSWGDIGWRGPDPPRGHGVHRYRFRLYALDAMLPLDAALERAALLAALSGHVLAEAELVGTYGR
jgi:hypothetical protein